VAGTGFAAFESRHGASVCGCRRGRSLGTTVTIAQPNAECDANGITRRDAHAS